MRWEEEIAAMLQEVESETVRFDVEQELTSIQKSTARNNISITVTAEQLNRTDYMITMNY